MKKKIIGCIVLSAILALVWVGTASAADKFPSKRITYKICFNPGGESDITARFQEAALKKALGVDVSITYQIGGGGALCWAELVRTKPDGYTIAGHNLPHIARPTDGDGLCRIQDLGSQANLHVREHTECPARPQ